MLRAKRLGGRLSPDGAAHKVRRAAVCVAVRYENCEGGPRMLKGKKGVILNVANKHSIAWGIAAAASNAGAELAIGYQGERFEKNVRELAKELSNALVVSCDVTKDEEIDAMANSLKEAWGSIDFLVHSIAFAPRESLDGLYVDTKRADYAIAQEISAYSLVALAKAVRPLMSEGGSILCLTYFGAEKVVPHYNVMGVAKAALEASTRYLAHDLGPQQIRVNALSAGPISTLAARGIAGFTDMRKIHSDRAPLRRNVQLEEIGNAAVFLLSDMSSAITGEVVHVDCGYNIVGM